MNIKLVTGRRTSQLGGWEEELQIHFSDRIAPSWFVSANVVSFSFAPVSSVFIRMHCLSEAFEFVVS
jgi:hypothetical protein